MTLKATCEIGISDREGQFWVGQRGGMLQGGDPGGRGNVEFFDFAGNRIHNEYFESSNIFATQDRIVKQEIENYFVFNSDMWFMYITHVGMQPISETEIKRGAYLNFGSAGSPRILQPFFTCPALTTCIAYESPPDVVLEAIKVIRKSYKGEWRVLVISKDGGGFNIR